MYRDDVLAGRSALARARPCHVKQPSPQLWKASPSFHLEKGVNVPNNLLLVISRLSKVDKCYYKIRELVNVEIGEYGF